MFKILPLLMFCRFFIIKDILEQNEDGFMFHDWLTAVSNANEILQILYVPYPYQGSSSDVWWSMNRYKILNLRTNEPWGWKCFPKLLLDSLNTAIKFAAKAINDWNLQLSSNKKQNKKKNPRKHVTMMKLSIKENKFDFMMRQ